MRRSGACSFSSSTFMEHLISRRLCSIVGCCSVAQSCLTLWPCGLQHARLPCPSPSPRICSNSCPLSRWCHLTISSSVVPFSSCLQSFLESESFPVSQLFASSGQRIEASASASVLPGIHYHWVGMLREIFKEDEVAPCQAQTKDGKKTEEKGVTSSCRDQGKLPGERESSCRS